MADRTALHCADTDRAIPALLTESCFPRNVPVMDSQSGSVLGIQSYLLGVVNLLVSCSGIAGVPGVSANEKMKTFSLSHFRSPYSLAHGPQIMAPMKSNLHTHCTRVLSTVILKSELLRREIPRRVYFQSSWRPSLRSRPERSRRTSQVGASRSWETSFEIFCEIRSVRLQRDTAESASTSWEQKWHDTDFESIFIITTPRKRASLLGRVIT